MSRRRCGGSWAWTRGWRQRTDETTICRFRHLLEQHALGELMLDAVNVHLEAKGIRIATGTIVDATIIHAPSSTKNQSGERAPEMHQTRKGKQWYFGLKAHIGVDSKEGTMHSVATSAASGGGQAYAARPTARRRAPHRPDLHPGLG
jgi:IS5 family transposase